MDAFWIILTGSLVAVCCAMVGSFLVLKGMTMVGDAISHAVLPGIALAFLLSGSRDTLPMLIGAGAVGMLSAFLIETLSRRGGLQADASIGVTFTWLFALGVMIITYYAGNVDLDQDCVLYGEIAYVPLDMWTLESGAEMGPRAVWMMGGVFAAVLGIILLFFKELKLTTFDPQFAAALGIAPLLWHYVLMGCVSLTTVAAFESVGAIIVVALFVVPPATAYLFTHNLRSMLWISSALGISCAVGGYYLAVAIDGSIAGAMAVVAGAEFVLAVLFAPEGGVVTKLLKRENEEPEFLKGEVLKA
ncbi:MAG TPA: metal ABC transporter permease [Patescibacteria group bacterium]|nr:metal ABC transporter permease [Patescibacteria group bacterium]